MTLEATSRPYTIEEIEERIKKPTYEAEFTIAFNRDDYLYEDTIIVPLSLPRMVWKILQGCSESSGLQQAKEVAEEFICDKAWEMLSAT